MMQRQLATSSDERPWCSRIIRCTYKSSSPCATVYSGRRDAGTLRHNPQCQQLFMSLSLMANSNSTCCNFHLLRNLYMFNKSGALCRIYPYFFMLILQKPYFFIDLHFFDQQTRFAYLQESLHNWRSRSELACKYCWKSRGRVLQHPVCGQV